MKIFKSKDVATHICSADRKKVLFYISQDIANSTFLHFELQFVVFGYYVEHLYSLRDESTMDLQTNIILF